MGQSEKDYTSIPIDVVLAMTAKAVKVDTPFGEFWIPYSLIEEDSLSQLPDVDELQVERWFVRKEGIE